VGVACVSDVLGPSGPPERDELRAPTPFSLGERSTACSEHRSPYQPCRPVIALHKTDEGRPSRRASSHTRRESERLAHCVPRPMSRRATRGSRRPIVAPRGDGWPPGRITQSDVLDRSGGL
jgi:hypothetical protein